MQPLAIGLATLRGSSAVALGLLALASLPDAQLPGQGCIDPPVCGAWEGPYDWGIVTCSGNDSLSHCTVGVCDEPPWGEIAHAVLVLKDATSSTQEWRVLLVNTGNPGDVSIGQPWWTWDPATPGDVQANPVPNPLSEIVFCSGHTALADGRILFAGGQLWPPAGGALDCTGSGPTWAWIYNPTSDGWEVQPDMTAGRYYPSGLLDTDGRAVVIAGDTANPTTFEVFAPAAPGTAGSWSVTHDYSTVEECPAAYPHAHLLPKRGATYRATLFISSPFYTQALWPCVGANVEIPPQVLPLPSSPGDYSLPWEVGPAPGTDPRRADNGSVLLVDTTVAAPTATVYITAGREHPFDAPTNLETDTAEYFLDPQTPAPTTGVALPAMNIGRWEASFMLIPGRRILALGGETTDTQVGVILTPEMLDLQDIGAGWKELANHQQKREYHSWAILLPDGRVLLGGGRKTWPGSDPAYMHAEIFNPPYDKNGQATRKARFAGNSPTSMDYGVPKDFTLSIEPPEGIWEFELLRPGSMTHTVDFDQRMVLVAHQSLGNGVYRLTAPAGPDLAPPGWYMLFAVSNDGVPSVARFVQLQ